MLRSSVKRRRASLRLHEESQYSQRKLHFDATASAAPAARKARKLENHVDHASRLLWGELADRVADEIRILAGDAYVEDY